MSYACGCSRTQWAPGQREKRAPAACYCAYGCVPRFSHGPLSLAQALLVAEGLPSASHWVAALAFCTLAFCSATNARRWAVRLPAGAGRRRRMRAVHGRASQSPVQMGQMHAAARPMLTTKRRRAPRRARHGQQVVRRGFSRSIEVLRARQPAPGGRLRRVVDVALDRGAGDGLRGPRHSRAARPLHASDYWKGAGELRRDFEAPGPARRVALLVRHQPVLKSTSALGYERPVKLHAIEQTRIRGHEPGA